MKMFEVMHKTHKTHLDRSRFNRQLRVQRKQQDYNQQPYIPVSATYLIYHASN